MKRNLRRSWERDGNIGTYSSIDGVDQASRPSGRGRARPRFRPRAAANPRPKTPRRGRHGPAHSPQPRREAAAPAAPRRHPAAPGCRKRSRRDARQRRNLLSPRRLREASDVSGSAAGAPSSPRKSSAAGTGRSFRKITSSWLPRLKRGAWLWALERPHGVAGPGRSAIVPGLASSNQDCGVSAAAIRGRAANKGGDAQSGQEFSSVKVEESAWA